MENILHEDSRAILLHDGYDVVVAGGGVAGVAAALAAARNGKRVLLLERMFALGGLATLGLITIYLPLCDGRGNQVSFGMAEELFHLSIRHGHEDLYPDTWLEPGKEAGRREQRMEVQYNGQVFAILLEQLLQEAGVEILYGVTLCGAQMQGDRIRAVITESKSGREAFGAAAFIDATGDADLCRYAGEETVLHQKGNLLAAWFYDVREGEYRLNKLGGSDVPREGRAQAAALIEGRYGGVDTPEVSRMMMESHKRLLNRFLEGGGVSRAHGLATMATIPQLRMTRLLRGRYDWKEADVFRPMWDSVGMISDWRKRGPVFEVPFSALQGRVCRNLLAAGRCISTEDDIWDVSRVIPACVLTGEAAGTAAALTDDFWNLDTARLQKRLVEQGGRLHWEELEKV